MITCDVFEVKLEERGRSLAISFLTDLPCGTIALVDAYRTYVDYEGAECVWTLASFECELVRSCAGDLNGGNVVFNIDIADASALKEHLEEEHSYSTGIRSRVSEEVIVSVVVGARQRLKAFGRHNENLSGAMVDVSVRPHCVEVQSVCKIPMLDKFQPVR